jgi:hypothetical protein
MSVSFSKSLVKEYQDELYSAYGLFVSEHDAQLHLKSLANALFPSSQGAPDSPDALASESGALEVGAVLPRLRDIETKNYE